MGFLNKKVTVENVNFQKGREQILKVITEIEASKSTISPEISKAVDEAVSLGIAEAEGTAYIEYLQNDPFDIEWFVKILNSLNSKAKYTEAGNFCLNFNNYIKANESTEASEDELGDKPTIKDSDVLLFQEEVANSKISASSLLNFVFNRMPESSKDSDNLVKSVINYVNSL